jgi:ATP-binding cassette subfamily B protein
MILLLVQGLIPAASISLTPRAINALVSVTGSGISAANVQKVIVPVGLMAGIMLVGEVLNSAAEWIRTAQSELVQDYVTGLIQKQSVAVDYGFYESSEYNDKLDRAREGASGRSLALARKYWQVLTKHRYFVCDGCNLGSLWFWATHHFSSQCFSCFLCFDIFK